MRNDFKQLADELGIKITELAAEYIKRQMEKGGSLIKGVRVDVRKAGCSGYEYVLSLAENVWQFDYVFDHKTHEVAVIVDKEIYLKYLKGGTVIDFKKEGLNEGLKIMNPNAVSECGCGESFNLAG
ncbi:MAG TPA: iron-sulfur cluster assembly accessory protein [Gammaproteobacteria bacterium]|nr:iron-sulfur cluster assembly accessory protein [Gammaproteobacteria bacterium]